VRTSLLTVRRESLGARGLNQKYTDNSGQGFKAPRVQANQKNAEKIEQSDKEKLYGAAVPAEESTTG
jgi:hypothetical protein